MTPNSELVLNYLKKNYGKEFSKKEISEALNISIPAVTGSLNGLIKKEYATTTRTEEVVVTPATETRKAQVKNVLYHTLTEKGLSYDPVEEARLIAEAKAQKKAAKDNA